MLFCQNAYPCGCHHVQPAHVWLAIYVMLQKGMVYKYASNTYIIMMGCMLAKLLWCVKSLCMGVRMELTVLMSTIRVTVRLKLSTNVLPLKWHWIIRHRSDITIIQTTSQKGQAITWPCWLWGFLHHSTSYVIYRSVLVMAFKAMLTAHCMNLVWPLSLLFVAYYDNVNAVKATSTWEPCSSHTHGAQGGLWQYV